MKKKLKIIILILIILGGSAAFWYWKNRPGKMSELLISGRIEGYETNIGPKIGGRVDFVAGREGELVKKGQLLVKISDDDIQAQLRGANSRILMSQEQESDSSFQVEAIKSQIEEARIKLQQSKEEASSEIYQAESSVALAQARLAESQAALEQAIAELELAKKRKQRYQIMLARGAVSTDENDQAQTTCDTAEAIVKAKRALLTVTQKDYKKSMGALEQARSMRLNPPMRSSQIATLQKQLSQAEHKLKSAKHEIANVKAQRDEVQSSIDYLTVESPIDGVITARSVEPGAVVTPGQTLLSVINLDEVYLRGYVPEGRIGEVQVGQTAKVFLDSFPKKPFEGKVTQIDPEGSFTPENIYFKDDRVKQVFGIKISIKQAEHFAKPGMPADAEIVPEKKM